MLLNKIGNFTFLQLSGPPQRTRIDWRLRVRAGVDGVAIWNAGKRGQPFQVQTLAWTQTLDQAHDLLANYRALGADLAAGVQMVRAGWDTANTLYKVLDVEPAPGFPRAIKGNIGGDPNTYFAELVCAWTLLALDVGG